MMASSWWLLTLALLYYAQIKSAFAQYHWNCSIPDSNGERYIPGIERDYSAISARSSVPIIVTTAGGEINLYRVRTLNGDCYGEVTAVQFCYRYNTDGPGEAVFNWTVLILEETNVFTITRIIAIVSHPEELDGNDCMDVGGGQIECCDREYINSFNFQGSNMFAFGVTESAQGNTHGATLLGIHESLAEYTVDTLQFSRYGYSISVGTTLPRPGGAPRGLRLLWLVIGSSPTATPISTDARTTSSLIGHHTTDIDAQITGIPTSQDNSTDAQATSLRFPTDHHSGIDAAVSTSQDIILATQEERDSTAAAMASILTLVGAVVGAVILLSAITVLILLMACLIRKNKILKRELNSGNGREMRSSMVEKTDTADIEVDTNPSYIPLCITQSNIAYGEVAMNQVGNKLYEIMDPPIEVTVNQDGDGLYEIIDPPIDDSTTRSAYNEQHEKSEENSNDYAYIS